ncbi:MAG: hypothetical protein BAA04_03925 [Firmicutes bacterium ZCTH02-B6]|nr:MAG: hypothetical protein BAA04_03925 [Firmicutes bacterium ZCTH02-B6]
MEWRTDLRTNLRVVRAIIAKDWRVYWRYPVNAFMSLLTPIMWLTPVFFLGLTFSRDGDALGFRASTGTGDFVAFMVLGGVVASYVRTVFWQMGFSLKTEMEQGTLESLWLTPNSRLWLLVGRSVVNVLLTAINTVTVMAAVYLLFGFEMTGNVGQALLILLPLIVALYGFGIAYAGIVLYVKDANSLTDLTSFFVEVVSGFNYPVTALPRALMVVGLALPVTYGVDAIRAIVLGTRPLVPVQVSVAVVLVSVVVFWVLGRWIFNRVDARVRAMGTLGTH